MRRKVSQLVNKFRSYCVASYRAVLPTVVVFAIAVALPPFSLFEDRAAGMLQSHLLLELFAVIVAILIAAISWQTLEKELSPESGILLAGFATVACMDLVHALTYDGMPRLITESSTQRAIFFWLAGRTCVAATLLALVIGRGPHLHRRTWLGLAFIVSGATFYLGTFRLDLIPPLFVPNVGVTPLKAGFEYGLFGLDVILALLFIHQSTKQTQTRAFALATSCLVMAMGEIVFSNYKAPSDFLNNFGHAFKVVSYAFMYQTVFVSAIRRPYDVARQSEARFRALTELSADWMWEQDSEFRFTELSQQVSLVGVRSLTGLCLWDLPLQGVTQADWNAYRSSIQRHEAFKDFCCLVELTPGNFRWIALSGGPTFDDHGRFQGYRGIGSDISDKKAVEQQIEYMAYHDPLTGLPNRRLVQDRFFQATAQANRSGTKVALAFLDLDSFKRINDTLGHDVGDALLKDIGKRLQACIRDTDTLSRQGGDEFLLVLTGLEQVDDSAQVLIKIMDLLQEPIRVADNELSTSASMGVAIYPDDGSNFETLMKKADIAMYRAKDAGRNTYRFYDQAMNVDAVEHLVIRNGLKRALDRGEFLLHFQPQLDLRSGRVTGAEALIRWNHPELGMVSPARFIPVAEESGLIVPIGKWVLQEACLQAMKWHQAGFHDLTVAVNLSAIQFKRGDLEQSVLFALEKSGMDPRHLELELTESILIQNVESVLASVKRLKATGIKISIDDFGTGYSSLSYLKRFDIDKLKIDQSFVRDLTSDPDDAGIVRAIIQMAQNLKLQTIAEGVETQEILDELRGYGCDEAQGYHFARPMPGDALLAFLRNAGQTTAYASSGK